MTRVQPGAPSITSRPKTRLTVKLVAFVAAASVVTACLLALGVWQVRRLSWKLDLIARVDARVQAPPSVFPGPAEWPGLTAEAAEYRHVTARGRFANDRETLVQAVTVHGGGFWVMTPFSTDDGLTVLVNRGFVSFDKRDPTARPERQAEAETAVTGLLRITEPHGGFLRSNDSTDNLWYSRDVDAIARARGLTAPVAPYFVDADSTPNAGGFPIGGLTVIAFPNNHLVYALTWFALAAMLAGAVVWVIRDAGRPRRPGETA